MRLLSLLFLLGCGPKKSDVSDAYEEPAPQEESGVAGVAGGSQAARSAPPEWMARVPADGASQVHLLDAGAEPRRVLQLHPSQGQSTTLRMVMEMDMAMQMQGLDMPAMDIPPIYMDIQSTVTEVRPDGAFRTSVEFIDAGVEDAEGVDPMMKDTFAQAFAMVRGLKGSSLTDPSGRVLEMDFEVPSDPMLQQQISQMNNSASNLSAPFPADPIGVGARWEVLMRQETNGMPLYQQAVFELKELAGDRVRLSADIDQYIAPDADIPGMPADADVQFLSFDSEGTGEILMDLSQGGPADATMTIRTAMLMSVAMTGMPAQQMGMDMNISLRIAPK